MRTRISIRWTHVSTPFDGHGTCYSTSFMPNWWGQLAYQCFKTTCHRNKVSSRKRKPCQAHVNFSLYPSLAFKAYTLYWISRRRIWCFLRAVHNVFFRRFQAHNWLQLYKCILCFVLFSALCFFFFRFRKYKVWLSQNQSKLMIQSQSQTREMCDALPAQVRSRERVTCNDRYEQRILGLAYKRLLALVLLDSAHIHISNI